MEWPLTPMRETATNPPLTSARVLLGTIAATGALALTSVVAMAPTKETILLIGALALPWVTAALTLGLPTLISTFTSHRRGTRPAPAMRAGLPVRTWRLPGAAAAIALLLLAGVIAQQSTESSPASTVAASPGGAGEGATSAQVVSATISTD